MATEILPVGKLKPESLIRLLRHTSQAPELVVGPAVGEDAAVIDQGNRYLVVSTDPITFATDRCGWYSVCVNANDIAACGGTPRYYSAAIVLPLAVGVHNMMFFPSSTPAFTDSSCGG